MCACRIRETLPGKSSKVPIRYCTASTVRWNPANPCRPSRWTKAKPKCSPAPLSLKYDDPDKPAPITESQILMPRRFDDRRPDLWSVFNRTQENLTKGGLHGRSANGRRQQTRPVQGIDSDIRLNRALWLLADGLRQLKA